jgi:light-independent protochlorophyllide reductase B subunit
MPDSLKMSKQLSPSVQPKEMKIQEIHRPSSFEGALWAALSIRDARVIFHSPPGCYLMQHMNILCNEWNPDFYSTCLSYGNVMQGAEDRLEQVMRKAITELPEAIIVVTAPTVEITGEDVEGVVNKVGFSKTVIIHPPLGGTLHQGKEKAFLSLLSLMKPSVKKIDKTVNLIGPTLNTFNWLADVYELKRILSRIGVTVNSVLTANATVQQIEQAPQASLNVCIYPFDCGIEMAKVMKEKFSLPYVANHIPIGFEETAFWVEEMADFFRIDAKDYLKEEMESGFDLVRSLIVFPVFFETTAALSLENCDTYSVGISHFLNQELGMPICFAAVATEAAKAKVSKVCPHVLLAPTMEEKKQKFLELSPTVILGNFYDLKVATELGFQNFLYADIPLIGYIPTENDPFMGFMGAKSLIQRIGNQIYTKIFIETKGEFEGVISVGEIPWEIDAERALGRISEFIPHVVRTTAIKKMHQVAEEIAVKRRSKVTLGILKEVADQLTPTRFKSRFSEIFAGVEMVSQESIPHGGQEEESLEGLTFPLEWDDDAKEMIKMVPLEFRVKALAGTEEFAQRHHYQRVTTEVVEEYRKELGF